MAEYDEMGNYTGYGADTGPVSPYDFEAEDRKKEELKQQLEAEAKRQDELASEVSHKQEVTTYGDGSRTVNTTHELPAGAAMPIAPVAPTDYNANIAQQESGSNPNIGYHDRSKGSAYGTYGMTAGGYEDARKVNPNLPADITQATPAQQTQAMDAYTQQNAKYLQAYGVEPTQNNLSAAHFLGAKGLSDYLKTGQISPQAAAANGGYDNAKRIVNQRLGGQSAPASGGVAGQAGGGRGNAAYPTAQPGEGVQVATGQGVQGTVGEAPTGPVAPTEQPFTGQGLKMPAQGGLPQGFTPMAGEEGSKSHIDQYQSAQNDPGALMKLSADSTAPSWMQDRARNRAADIITQQRDMQNAQEKLSTATPTDLAKYMREKTTGGSWLKAIFYSAIGATQLAQEEGAKLGIGTEKVVLDANGKANIVKVAVNGTPLEGYSADTGKKLSAEELISAVGGGGMKGAVTGQTMGYNKNGDVISHTVQANGQGVVWKNETTGQRLAGAPEGYHTGKDQRSALGDTAFKQSMTADEAENRKQTAAGLKPLYTPAQIQERAQGKRDALMGIGGTTPAATPMAAPIAQAAPQAMPAAPTTGPVAPTAQAAPTTGPVAPATAVTGGTGTALNPDLETQAQAIARGDVAMPTGMGASNRRNQAINNRVYEINPKYDPTIYSGRKKTEEAFTTGKQGDVVRSMNVAVDHLDTLQEAAKALNNKDLRMFNDVAQRYATAIGQPAPTNFKALQTLVGSEVAKAIQGGATALGDREEIRKEIDLANSPQQLAGVIDKYQHLMSGQLTGLKQQYTSGGGNRWEGKINPRTNEIMAKVEQEKNAARPAGGIPAAYEDKSKEQRYQEWLKKRNQGQ
jgi:hypothetical protein